MYRVATTADRTALLALWDEAFPGEHDYAETFLDHTLGQTYAAVLEGAGHVVAMGFGFDLGVECETYRYLYAFAVRKDRRGQGHGRQFLTAYEDAARADGCVGILAVVMPDGPWGFYEKLGYAPVLRRRPHVDATVPVAPSPALTYPPAMRALADLVVPDPYELATPGEGSPYGVLKRFDGTLPSRIPYLALTLE